MMSLPGTRTPYHTSPTLNLLSLDYNERIYAISYGMAFRYDTYDICITDTYVCTYRWYMYHVGHMYHWCICLKTLKSWEDLDSCVSIFSLPATRPNFWEKFGHVCKPSSLNSFGHFTGYCAIPCIGREFGWVIHHWPCVIFTHVCIQHIEPPLTLSFDSCTDSLIYFSWFFCLTKEHRHSQLNLYLCHAFGSFHFNPSKAWCGCLLTFLWSFVLPSN